MMLTGCKDYDADAVVSDEPVSVQLAYTISTSGYGNVTRQADAIVQNDLTNPRVPEFLRLIPLAASAPRVSDFSWEDPVNKDNPTSLFFRSRYCDLNIGVDGCLVYGRVIDKPVPANVNVSRKMYNGILDAHFPDHIKTETDVNEGIWFDHVPIYNDRDETSGKLNIPNKAQDLADCLTAITRADNWYTSTDESLQNLLKKFTNEGNSLPGSAASVKKWIDNLIYLIDVDLADNNTPPEVKETLTTIRDVATSQSISGDYPRNFELPDGAAVLRWADVQEGETTVKKFMPQVNATTLDNINSIDRFAYPVPLYYSLATTISTSEEKVDFETLYNTVNSTSEKTAWNQIVEDSKFNGNRVTAATKAVVLNHPVQYAVAQLQVNVKASSLSLKDAKGNSVLVGEHYFPLTGVIVSDQRPVDFKFEQEIIEEGSHAEDNVKFIYDSYMDNPYYLATAGDKTWTNACNTLVFESHIDEDVHIILEFENNSDQDFECIDGVVYRGTRFYMIGLVEPAHYNTEESTLDTENNRRVFTRDYITRVNMTVSSLAKAYNVPPNLLTNNLEVGVETTPQWTAATPTSLRLE
jgi:hypothetical protein